MNPRLLPLTFDPIGLFESVNAPYLSRLITIKFYPELCKISTDLKEIRCPTSKSRIAALQYPYCFKFKGLLKEIEYNTLLIKK